MRFSFYDRQDEFRRLLKARRNKEGTFCCIYGRRRLGKSRLLQESLPASSVYFVCDEREAPLQRQSLAIQIAALLPGFADVTYGDWGSLLERWWKEAAPGMVLAVDEFPYLAKTSPELPSILQRLVDTHRSKSVHLILCGSLQSMMQGMVLDASAPLYGRADEIIALRPLAPFWLGKALRLGNGWDVIQAYSLWGGSPRYWEGAADYASLWQAMKALVLDPLGRFHQEPMRLLHDDMRETVQAASILSLIGRGCHRLFEIAARLQKPATSLARPIQRLRELELIRKEQPFGSPEKSSKTTLYRLQDPFLGFWFRYVEPNRSRLASQAIEMVANEIRRDYSRHCGEIWEELVRKSIVRLNLTGRRWNEAHRWWGKGNDGKPLEVDVVSESLNGAELLVGEACLNLNTSEYKRTYERLLQKAKRLPFSSRYKKIVATLFVASKPAARLPAAWRGKVILVDQVLSEK